MSRKSRTSNQANTEKTGEVDAYHIESVIGEGAFATVTLCKRTKDAKIFAAKMIRFENSRRMKWETENEIEILRTLHNHPFIVSIYDIIRESESTYIIMEYISNSTLLEGIISWPNFNEADVRFVMLQILEAVHFCHQQRIVHRDLTPGNILWFHRPTFKYPNTIPWIKIIDFNISRKIKDGKNQIISYPMGRELFMAPEALKDLSEIGFPNDIWSMGVILFILLVGYPPFWDDNYSFLLKSIDEGDFVMPRKYWMDISLEAQDLVHKMKDFGDVMMLPLKALKRGYQTLMSELKLLSVDPVQRITAENALKHGWLLGSFNDEKDSSNMCSISMVQARITVFLNRCKKTKRKSSKIHKFSLNIKKSRLPYVPDSELDSLASHIIDETYR